MEVIEKAIFPDYDGVLNKAIINKFSTLLLLIMVGGTIWIMGNLALRMVMPTQL